MATITVELTDASGSWIAPTGVTSVKIECWGGGTSGISGSEFFAGRGGGGGAYARVDAESVTPGESYGYIIGQGGSVSEGGFTQMSGPALLYPTLVRADGATARNGGTIVDSFGDQVYSGGTGAVASGNNGGGGGGAGGDSQNGSSATVAPTPGAGGSAYGGSGGTGGGANLPGQDGFLIGGGGGGGGKGSPTSGGAGKRGLIKITYEKPVAGRTVCGLPLFFNE